MLKFQKVKKEFLKNYPNGFIEKDQKNKVKIQFKKEGKIYKYSFKDHLSLLNKLLNDQYITQEKADFIKDQIEEIKKLKNKKLNGFYNEWTKQIEKSKKTDPDIKGYNNEIKYLKSKIENKIII